MIYLKGFGKLIDFLGFVHQVLYFCYIMCVMTEFLNVCMQKGDISYKLLLFIRVTGKYISAYINYENLFSNKHLFIILVKCRNDILYLFKSSSYLKKYSTFTTLLYLSYAIY